MSTHKISNVPLKDFKVFLTKAGCEYAGTVGGHEKWKKQGLSRPIIIQTHVNPIPERIIKESLKNLNLTKQDLFDIIFLK